MTYRARGFIAYTNIGSSGENRGSVLRRQRRVTIDLPAGPREDRNMSAITDAAKSSRGVDPWILALIY